MTVFDPAFLVDRADPEWAAYYAATDVKHFGNPSEPGSKFTDPSLKKIEDVLMLAYQQRGNLEGDDQAQFIRLGSPLEAFNEGYRYLFVRTPGTVGIKHSTRIPDEELVRVVRTKPGAPVSIVADVATQETTDYGVIILADDEITGTPRLITTFPGLVTKTSRVDELEIFEGKTVPLGAVRHFYETPFWVNTRLLNS